MYEWILGICHPALIKILPFVPTHSQHLHTLPQQQTLIAKETKPDGESMKDTRQGVHIQIDVAAKALFGVLL